MSVNMFVPYPFHYYSSDGDKTCVIYQKYSFCFLSVAIATVQLVLNKSDSHNLFTHDLFNEYIYNIVFYLPLYFISLYAINTIPI